MIEIRRGRVSPPKSTELARHQPAGEPRRQSMRYPSFGVAAFAGAVMLTLCAASTPCAFAACPDFTFPTTYPSGGVNPFAVAVGDFNGDGKSDLAVANQFSNSISIF